MQLRASDRLLWLGITLAVGAGCTGRTGRVGDPAHPAGPAQTQSRDQRVLADGELDRLIEQTWRDAKVKPAPLSDDGEYLRRVTLDLAGRTPTLDEARAFLADKRSGKRAGLVDRLLASADFSAHWGDVYAEMLYGSEARGKKIEKQADPREFLVQAFAENRRYDRLTWEILTADGDLRDNGAVAFIAARARGGGGIESVTGATARLFLGLQIQCAQCHDHPYDARWKQEDFYGLVAYFARTKAKNEKTMMGGRSVAVVDQKKGQAKMRKPRSESEVVVEPRFLGFRPTERSNETRRQTLARSIIDSDLFPKTMVARTWAQLFGAGVVNPWDDLGGEKDPKHPELLVRLADDFRSSGFDVKRMLRNMVLSTAYQRSSAAAPGTPDDGGAAVRSFARASVRPLSPEQLYRAVAVATGLREAAGASGGEETVSRRERQALAELKFAFDDDEMAEANAFDGTVPQTLLLMNGGLTNEGVRAKRDNVVGAALASSREPAARLESLFLAVYARSPTPDERTHFLAYVKQQGGERTAWEDVHFALLTSTESITNH